jgi:hypothetical protein
MKKWTIGIVNYKSSSYMEYQLKILYEFNNPEEFDVIIVDNSEPIEKKFFVNLKKEYKNYDNLTIIYNESTSDEFKLRTSSQHAEGLNIILEKSNSNYLLVHDPDFFWVKKNYLDILETQIKNGSTVVGAPYGVAIKTGATNFPSAFGCAYDLLRVKKDKLNFDAGTTKQKEEEHRYPGWKMRAKYSNDQFTSFPQGISNLPFLFGDHSYFSIPRYYTFNNEVIAYHLFRGSFVSDSAQHVKNAHKIKTPKLYKDTRYLYSKYFYSKISGNIFNIFKYRKPNIVFRNVFNLLSQKHIDNSKSPYKFSKSLRRLIRSKTFSL